MHGRRFAWAHQIWLTAVTLLPGLSTVQAAIEDLLAIITSGGWVTLPDVATWASSTTFTCTDNAANQAYFAEGSYLMGNVAGGGYIVPLRVTDYTTGTVTVDGAANPLGVGTSALLFQRWYGGAGGPVLEIATVASIAGSYPAASYPAGWRAIVDDIDEPMLQCCDCGGTKRWLGGTVLFSTEEERLTISASNTNFATATFNTKAAGLWVDSVGFYARAVSTAHDATDNYSAGIYVHGTDSGTLFTTNGLTTDGAAYKKSANLYTDIPADGAAVDYSVAGRIYLTKNNSAGNMYVAGYSFSGRHVYA